MGENTTFDKLLNHVKSVRHIDIGDCLSFTKRKTMTDFALTSSLLLIYRYAERLGYKIQVRDMVASGHKSHQMATELDFDLQGNQGTRNPIVHVNMAVDLLRLKDRIKSHLDAFRIGIYFDYLNKASAKTYDDFEKAYNGKPSGATMHLGVRYKWKNKVYRGKRLTGTVFGIWGRGGKSYGRSDEWEKRIKSWKIGYLDDRALTQLAEDVLEDYKELDNNPPRTRPTTWTPRLLTDLIVPDFQSPSERNKGNPPGTHPITWTPGLLDGIITKRSGRRGGVGLQRGPLGITGRTKR